MMIHEYICLIWILIGLSLGLLELSNPGFFFFLSCSFGAFAGAIAAWHHASIMMQMIIATTITLISLGGLCYLLKKYAFSQSGFERHATNLDALIGKEGMALQTISGKKYGLIKVRGEIWSAETDEGIIIEKNDHATVVKVSGNKLLVKKIVSKNEA